jgi:glycosyltransferase involved in cell wall biosynthesis
MNENPRVSIILPTYNGGRFIGQAIESVLKQSFEDFELLVIDDGSTDETPEIIYHFSERDPRIIYLNNDKNLGIQKSLNRGMREAKGEYIARIDDDDVWIDKDKLRKQVDFLDAHLDHVLVGTGAVIVNEKGKELFRYFNPETDTEIREKILGKICFTHPTVMFKKDATIKVNGYDENEKIRDREDYDLWLKLGIIGKLANLRIIGVKKMLRSGSITSKNKIKRFKERIKFIKKYRKCYPNYLRSLLRSYLRLIVYGYLDFSYFQVVKSRLKNLLGR